MRILCYILVVLFVTTTAVGQQINPVPDYIFRNSMSVGRNAPTDTSAYFSIGPRFGATRGFMPPMVVDTAAVTGTKRNGLLIYSIQRNSFLYWDSTGSRWSRLASLSDTITLSTRAWRQKGIDSLASVRIGGSGTINRVPKFTASGTIGNGSIADSSSSVQMTILSNGNIGIGKAAPTTKIDVVGDRINITPTTGTGSSSMQASNDGGSMFFGIDNSAGSSFNTGTAYAGAIWRSGTNPISVVNNNLERIRVHGNGRVSINTSSDNGFQTEINGTLKSSDAEIGAGNGTGVTVKGVWNRIEPTTGTNQTGVLMVNTGGTFAIGTENSAGGTFNTGTAYAGAIWRSGTNPIALVTNSTERMRVHGNGRVTIATATDAGYQFDVTGSMRNTTDAYFATSSGNVGIGTTTPGEKLDLNGNGVVRGSLIINNGSQNVTARVITPSGTTGRNVFFSSGGGSLAGTGNQASRNTSVGFLNLGAITTGSNNTAIGNETMNSLTTGGGNTSLGSFSMSNITTGSNNVGIGAGALNAITIANNNIAVGTDALGTMITGTQNTALGWSAGRYRLTSQSNSKSNNSVYIGYDTRSSADSADNEIVIGASVIGSGTNTVTIGNSSITQNYFTGEMLVGYTSDQGAFSLQANGNALINGNIRTAAPAGGTANDWRLGTVATVTPTSPNRTIEVSIGGTIYYIHAKTTND